MDDNYDGSINIGTRIDKSGFTKGLNQSLSGISQAVKRVGKVIKAPFRDVGLTAIQAIGGIRDFIDGIMGFLLKIGGLIGLTFSATAIIGFFKAAADNFSWLGSQYSQRLRALDVSFMRLQGIAAALWDTLLATFGPYLIDAISWLITQLTTLAQWIKAVGIVFFGLGDKSKGLKPATDNMGRLANETNRMNKAAQGALASFDELNVLSAKPMIPEVAEPPQSMIDKVMELKKAWDDLVKSVQDGSIWGRVWEWIKQGAAQAWEWVKQKAAEAWESVKMLAAIAWAYVQLGWYALWMVVVPKIVSDALEGVKALWGLWVQWWTANVIDPLKRLFSDLWGYIKTGAAVAWLAVQAAWATWTQWWTTNIINPIVNWFKTALANIGTFFTNAWTFIQGVWNAVGKWFTANVTDPIKNAFKTVVDWLPNAFNSAFQGVVSFVKGAVNTIIDFINGMLQAVVSGINAAINAMNTLSVQIPDWVPFVGGNVWGLSIPNVSAPQIPRLAQGAVIPGGAPFGAILGDQPAGQTNIEAPADLIRSIIQEELGNIQFTAEINFGGSLGELARILKPSLDHEQIRIGGQLIKGSNTINPIKVMKGV